MAWVLVTAVHTIAVGLRLAASGGEITYFAIYGTPTSLLAGLAYAYLSTPKMLLDAGDVL
jgi:hypothetical protein